MTTTEIKQICDDRLSLWTRRLVQEHATPYLLLGFSHDEKSGQHIVCTVEDVPDGDLIVALRGILQELEA